MKLFVKIVLLTAFLFNISCLKEEDTIVVIPPYSGGTFAPGVKGDPAYKDQIWINLETGEQIHTNRTDWDLGFYSGTEFRVIINGSIMMAAAPIDGVTELNQVNEMMIADMLSKVQVANFDLNNDIYVDDFAGEYLNDGTVIKEISANDSQNKVYLLNMGRKIYTGNMNPGTAYASGTVRGWKKIKILREGNDAYKIQYANLNDAEHREFIIPKNPDYNFTFFSIENEILTDIQPPKKDWDFCYTVFTNYLDEAGTYIFSDFMISNTLGNVGAYMVELSQGTNAENAYNDFTKNDVDASKFIFDDHRAIGDKWRDVFTDVYPNRFFVLRDGDGKNFKIRFIRMKDSEGYRGFYQFEYRPLD